MLVAGGAAPGSIPLYAAGLAVALGAEWTVFVSNDEDHRRRAVTMGSDAIDSADVSFDGLGEFDVTVDGSRDPATFVKVLERTGPAGFCTSPAEVVYASGPAPVNMYELYRKSVTLTTGWVHTHALWNEPLDLITSGRFDLSPVNSALVSFEDVAAALCEPFTKVVALRCEVGCTKPTDLFPPCWRTGPGFHLGSSYKAGDRRACSAAARVSTTSSQLSARCTSWREQSH